MSRVVRIYETGGPEVLRVEESPTPEPGPGEALIRQRVVGVNFIDTYHRSGLYPLPKLPSGIGMEAVGVVERVGPGVEGVTPGQRVAYVAGPPGSYADERVMPVERLVPLPDDIDDETVAAVLLKGMSVEALIRRVYPVRPGQRVLLHAAAGGFGLLACQWLAHLGASVIATVGSDEKAALVRDYGARDVIVYTREDFVARVRELTQGRGVPVVYDSVGKATLAGSLDCLERRGTLVLFGNASGQPAPLDLQLLATKGSLYVTRPVVFDYVATREELLASAREVFDRVRDGTLRVRIGQRFDLAEVVAAHRALESRRTTGSTVLLAQRS
ncbi:MAG: quinone oxidoreductase [Pseudomonadota bacterium]